MIALVVLVILRHVNPELNGPLLTAALLANGHAPGTEGMPGIFPVLLLLYYIILVNLLLFVFNIVPFPFFDGGKILVNYLPYEAGKTYERFSLYFMFIFFFIGYGIVMLFFAPFFSLFNHLLFTL